MNNINDLAHIGLYVRSVAESLKFYTEVLGFKKDFETPSDMALHLCFISNGNCRIELIEKGDREYVDGHINHICLKVDDIEAAVKSLAEKGIEIEGEIRSMPQVYNGIKLCFFRGPDGEHLEFNQFL